jgi:hypothetical protein
MTSAQTDRPTPRKPLRVWPGVAIVAVLLFARFGVKALTPGFGGFALGMQWAIGAMAAVVLWWLLLSRARWFERLGGLALMIGGLAGAWFLRHESMGPVWMIGYAMPFACVALVAGAVATRSLADGPRRARMATILLFACGGLFVRMTASAATTTRSSPGASRRAARSASSSKRGANRRQRLPRHRPRWRRCRARRPSPRLP